MAEKILNTRIITKNADYSAWETSQLELKKGEIALARLTTILPDGGEQVNYIAKVGNDCAFSDAPWLYAKASDVYAWAKKSGLDVADIPELQLTSTALGKVNEKFTTIDGQISALNTFKNTTVPTTYETIANADLVRNRVTEVEGKIAIIQGTEDTAGSLAKVLKDAKAYADEVVGDEKTRAEGVEAGLNTRLTAAEGDIDDLEAKLANVTNVMDFRGAVSAKPAVDGYQNGDVIVVTDGDDKGKEFVLSDGVWVEFGNTDANTAAIGDLQGRMTAAESDIETLNGQVADRYTKAEADGKFETIANADLIRGRVKAIEDDYLTAADKKDVTDRLDTAETDIDNLETKVTTLEGASATHISVKADNKMYLGEDVIIFDCGGAE